MCCGFNGSALLENERSGRGGGGCGNGLSECNASHVNVGVECIDASSLEPVHTPQTQTGWKVAFRRCPRI